MVADVEGLEGVSGDFVPAPPVPAKYVKPEPFWEELSDDE